MVLAYYRTPNAEPLVLDNLVEKSGRRRSARPAAIFSFNSEAIWSGVAGNAPREPVEPPASRWQIAATARSEGFD